ncbi:hypothetical protein JCM11641_008192 [Rhodosporidiobolus odoratus]
MAASSDYELLELLRSIPPLLSPDLPSPPPSPPSEPIPRSPVKRKHEHVDHKSPSSKPNAATTLGLGLEGTEGGPHEKDREQPAKRARPAPPPPPPAPGPAPPRLAPPPPPPALLAHPPTPELKSSPALTGARLPPSGSSSKPKAEEEWRKDWPKEKLRKLGAQCRELGRSLKHKGDAFARTTSEDARQARKDRLRGIVHQMDAILLYVFAFWCDDAAGRTCLTQNWQSVFGLIGFVRKAAEREGGASVIIGLCMRMEAVAVHTLAMHEQKALNFRGTQLSHTTSTSSSVLTTSSTSGSSRQAPPPPPPPAAEHTASPSSISTGSPAATSPSAAPSFLTSTTPSTSTSTASTSGTDSKAYQDFLRSFLRASPDLFRFQRLYSDSFSMLSPALLSTAFPRTWASCVQPVTFDHPDVTEFVLPCKPWRFAYPADLGRGVVGHQVAFCRMVLEEWSEREGLGWEAARLGEGF